MYGIPNRILFWTPRVLSIAFIGFLSLFALDVFDLRLGFWKTLAALVMHLIPVFVLVVALAWRWEWIGAAPYGISGLLYVAWVVSMSRPRSAGYEADLDSDDRGPGVPHRRVVPVGLAKKGRTARPVQAVKRGMAPPGAGFCGRAGDVSGGVC